MTTTHGHIESQPDERTNDAGNRRMGLNPAGKSRPGPLASSWRHVRENAILVAIFGQMVTFHDWISGPPMTERDRVKRYIVETRLATHKRRLAGR